MTNYAIGAVLLGVGTEFNERGQLPIGDVTNLEAGANRGAVS